MAPTMLSNGPIKSLARVKQIARDVLKHAHTQEQTDAAFFALRSPHAILAQPELQVRLLQVSGLHCVRCTRKVNLRIGEGLSSHNAPCGKGYCDHCERERAK